MGPSIRAPRPHPLTPSRAVVPAEGAADRLTAPWASAGAWPRGGGAEHCRPDGSGHSAPCASLPLPALLGAGVKSLCSSLTLSFSSCFEKSLVVYLRETGRKYVPRMPGRCFPSASQQIFSLKGDVCSASWCTTGSGQCHAGPQRPGDRAGQTPPTPDRSSEPCLSRPRLEHRREGLCLSPTHTLAVSTSGVPAQGTVGWGCSLGTSVDMRFTGPCGPLAWESEAPTLPQNVSRETGSRRVQGAQELCCCPQMPQQVVGRAVSLPAPCPSPDPGLCH